PACSDSFSAWMSGTSAGVRLPRGLAAKGKAEVGLIGCHAVKARVRAAAIVEIEIPPDRGACVRHAVVGVQVNLLAFDSPPKPRLCTRHRYRRRRSLLTSDENAMSVGAEMRLRGLRCQLAPASKLLQRFVISRLTRWTA